MSSDPIRIALEFFDHWSANRIDEALAMVAEKVPHDDVPFPDIVGREHIKAFHADSGIGRIFTVGWQVTQIAASGDVIPKESVDIVRHEDGGEISLPVMGPVTVKDGIISVWRDYFDPGDFSRRRWAL